jgi:hypothetical protein
MRKLPVRRDEGLVIEPVGDETVVYDDRTKEAHCLSPLTAVVFAHSDGRTTVEQIAVLATDRLGESVDTSSVVEALAQLDDRDLMDFVPPDGGLSRRDMIRRSAAAAGGAAMAPLITSVIAPSAIAASSATCANLLCCPCCTNSDLNIKDCCFIQNVTLNCECTGFRTIVYANQGLAPPANPANAKFCKPSGTGAPSDADCIAHFPANTVVATCTGSAKGFTACYNCVSSP